MCDQINIDLKCVFAKRLCITPFIRSFTCAFIKSETLSNMEVELILRHPQDLYQPGPLPMNLVSVHASKWRATSLAL